MKILKIIMSERNMSERQKMQMKCQKASQLDPINTKISKSPFVVFDIKTVFKAAGVYLFVWEGAHINICVSISASVQ